jgi:two-component system, sensor histidine kinase and response regulator
MSNESKSINFLIYVVDDSKVSRRVITSELNHLEEIQIKEFSNPLEVITSIEHERPDLVITDMVMPGIDGIELCFKLHSKYSDIPVVLISGTLDDDLIARAIQGGVTEAIPKPFELFQLSKLSQRLIDQKKGIYQYNILIVDDTKTFRTIIKATIKPLNLRTFEAENCDKAREILKTKEIDMIFLDDEMPNERGVDFCKKLKTSKEYKNIPIIAISANHDSEQLFLDYGVDDFIQKQNISTAVYLKTKNMLHRVRLEKELKQKILNEKALNHQKNKLLGVAAHDMRNPLSFIISCLDIIKPSINDDFMVELLKKVDNTSRNMLELLNDVLNVSSIASGNVKINLYEDSLKECILTAVEDSVAMAKNKKITLKSDLPDEHGEILTKIDKKRIHQVLTNLLSNAIKYSMPETEVKVKVSKQIEGWLVEVIDQGQGIPADELDGIFDEFKKTSVAATAGETSTGLGLAIVKKLVQCHGGNIWVESKTGKGSIFSFTLPM